MAKMVSKNFEEALGEITWIVGEYFLVRKLKVSGDFGDISDRCEMFGSMAIMEFDEPVMVRIKRLDQHGAASMIGFDLDTTVSLGYFVEPKSVFPNGLDYIRRKASKVNFFIEGYQYACEPSGVVNKGSEFIIMHVEEEAVVSELSRFLNDNDELNILTEKEVSWLEGRLVAGLGHQERSADDFDL